ncbi:hypothetical protein U14_01023 [Candidatus Moduliflexus flocculans]|uniref:Uncharacterized protein n=1 Tax=Candidatus Moduliflexus flocculans TaxID=1499966 RepID=A0A0S6VRI0_9BACT|nr:hypothetical protein U14_01023 [Candidatus Moduliflexus flocculans]
MLTIEGMFDGQTITYFGHVPFTQQKRVLITFLEETLLEPRSSAALDPIAALRGRDRQARLTEKLLAARKEDLARKHTP